MLMCMMLLLQVMMVAVMVVALLLLLLAMTTTPMNPTSSSLTPRQSKPSAAPYSITPMPMGAPLCTEQLLRAALSSSPALHAPAAASRHCHVTGLHHWRLLCGREMWSA
jgi:hypothetical protein